MEKWNEFAYTENYKNTTESLKSQSHNLLIWNKEWSSDLFLIGFYGLRVDEDFDELESQFHKQVRKTYYSLVQTTEEKSVLKLPVPV